MRKNKLTKNLLILLAIFSSSTTYADNINCSAGIFFKSNRTICDSPELLDLDKQVAEKYRELDTNSALRVEKRSWKDKRNSCKGEFECIKSLYQEKILELDSELAKQVQFRKEQERLEQERLMEARPSEGADEPINQTGFESTEGQVDSNEGDELAAVTSEIQDKNTNKSLLSLIFHLMFYLIILTSPITVPILIVYFKTRCPRCKRWFAKKEIGRNELDRYISSAPYTISRSKNHTSTGYRVVTVFVIEHFYRCKKCGYEWSVTKNHDR